MLRGLRPIRGNSPQKHRIEEVTGTPTPKITIETEPQNCAGCLRCQLICSLQHTGAFNPSQARITITEDERGLNSIVFADNCDRCGACAQYCEFGALKIERLIA